MINFIKNNKVLSVLLCLSFITFISGILISSLLDDNTKGEVSLNLINYIKSFKNNDISNSYLFSQLLKDILLVVSIWLFGISIIGVPIVIFLYLFQVLIYSLEFIFLILNINRVSIIFIFIYMFPIIIKLFVLFILLYYSCSYSILLIRLIFLKRDFSIRSITKRYIYIFLVCLLISLVCSVVEFYLIPKFLL